MSRAAVGAAACLCACDSGCIWLLRTNERAREAAVHFGRDAIHVHTAVGQKRPRILDLIDAPRIELDVREPRRLELRGVLIVAERAGDAADPQLHVAAD